MNLHKWEGKRHLRCYEISFRPPIARVLGFVFSTNSFHIAKIHLEFDEGAADHGFDGDDFGVISER
jgi:hypothetical protein